MIHTWRVSRLRQFMCQRSVSIVNKTAFELGAMLRSKFAINNIALTLKIVALFYVSRAYRRRLSSE